MRGGVFRRFGTGGRSAQPFRRRLRTALITRGGGRCTGRDLRSTSCFGRATNGGETLRVNTRGHQRGAHHRFLTSVPARMGMQCLWFQINISTGPRLFFDRRYEYHTFVTVTFLTGS